MDKETRRLPCRLTEEEIRAKSDEMANVVDERLKTDAERKRVAADFKSKVEALDLRIVENAVMVRTKTEYRDVEIEYRPDPIRLRMEEVRTDTGEIVGWRDMTSEERQMALDLPLGVKPARGRRVKAEVPDAG